MNTEEFLFKKYGPLLSHAQLAEVLGYTYGGLKLSLRSNNDVAKKFNPCKRKIGRRNYFETAAVVSVITTEHKNQD